MSERQSKPSASIMTRVYNCPASFRMNLSEIPTSSAAADEGTRLHRICELAIEATSEHRAEYDKLLSETSADQEQAVKFCLETVASIKCDMRMLERRLWSEAKTFSGKADAMLFEGESKLTIVDYKFGRGEVERAECNYQLAALAVLAMDNFKALESVRVMIIQPFALERAKRVTEAEFDLEAIDAAREELNAACLEAVESDKPSQKCGYWCKYCSSAYRCKVAQFEIIRQTKLAESEAGRSITKENALREFELCQTAEKFIKARLEAIKNFVHSNPDCDCGLVLKPGMKRSSLGDANEIFAIVERAGVTPDEFVSVCDVGLGKLQALYHEKRKLENPKQTKKASDVELKNALGEAGLLTYKESVPTLAKAE